MTLTPDEFKSALHNAIESDLEVPEPYRLVVETGLGETLACLRDPRTGANRFAVELGIVRDSDLADAAKRAADDLRQQLQDAKDADSSPKES